MTRVPKPYDFEPDPTFPPDHPHSGRQRCTAWNTNAGRQCLGLAMGTTGKCRVHGGKSRRGVASGRWKHGRYSKVLPTRLRDDYLAAISDSELLALDNELALTDARLLELFGKLDGQESSLIWRSLNRKWDEFQTLQQRSRMPNITEERKQKYLADAAEALQDIGSLVRHGAREWEVWKDIFETMEAKRRLSESEARRRERMQLLITVEEAYNLILFLQNLINDNVSSAREREAISEAIIRKVTAGAG